MRGSGISRTLFLFMLACDDNRERMVTGRAMIRAREIRYRYPGSSCDVLSGVSLDVASGELVVLLGANGSGKSTLSRLLARSLELQCGSIEVDGRNLQDSTHDGYVGYVRQDPESQFVAPIVFDEVAFGPCNLGLPAEEVRKRVHEALDDCRLSGFEDRVVDTLSGGEKQRLALAGVLAMHPRYLVLDEVMSQLGDASRLSLRSVLRGLTRRGVGILLVSHNPQEAAYADRVVVLEAGRLVWEGTPNLLFADEGRASRVFPGSRLSSALTVLVKDGCDLSGCRTVDQLASFAREACHRHELLDLLRVGSRHATSCSGGAAPSSSGLSLREIQLNLGGAQILDDVSIEIPSRHLTLVIGSSGAGKSTLARVAAGILEPDAGSVTLAGKPVVRGAIGLALQRPEDQLFLNTVLEDVEFGPVNLGASRDESRCRAQRSLKLLKVPEDLWPRSPFQLSGGEKRRVAIAGVIAMSPAALVLDEPTDGLDASCRTILINAVRDLADQGRSVIVVSHDVGEWVYAADDVVLLEGGRIRWRGTPSELALAYEVLERWGVGVPLELAMLGELTREDRDAR